VYQVFHALLRHVSNPDPAQYPAYPYRSSLPTLASNIINQQWKKHVNIPATIAAAIFSFSSTDVFLRDDIFSVADFIGEFGTAYLLQYKPDTLTHIQSVSDENNDNNSHRNNNDIQAPVLRARLLKQYIEFRGDRGCFQNRAR
jgi:hypothetical protein